ncbi:glutamine-serine-proline rich protein [Aspergillus sclerotioniger CBS 115572]|uniref:Glutamine-serine-proline rich protein n=1 Tax=Aspergillus sclerotioniger CBS 115572 TaxID=1450535 RepID=A0A317W1I2_9EURO|nr:glutamine-serine-proline rich protein [Aspergillus sclerotioniger CBS 115572]PWY78020.1 glutamine-serine-proline rich protein [Aspergillus sclerotioniger CBS 115572]
MAAQEYFNSGNAGDQRQQNPSPWSSPAINTPSSTGYGSYPPSVENGQDRYGASSPYPPQGAGGYNRPYSPYQQPHSGVASPQPNYQNPEYTSYNGGRPPYPQYDQSGPEPRPYPQQEGYGSHQQPPPYSPESTDPAAAGEGDKGLMGALAGGAAGGFAGHKVNHGILGTIGGAMMGSVAEDGFKKHKEKKEREEEERRQMEERRRMEEQYRMEEQRRMEERHRMEEQQRMHQQHHHRPPPHHGPPMRGNFSSSSRDIRLESHHDLVAACGRVSGELQLSCLPLNSVLSNSWGEFKWERNGNFAASARHVRLVDGGRVLEAELANGNGGWNRTWVRLDERITNQNGSLMFLD